MKAGWAEGRHGGRLIAALLLCPLLAGMPALPCAGAGDEGGASSRATSLRLTAEFDASFYTPDASVVISGQVTDQDGHGVGTAHVVAELWGGPFLGETVSSASGHYALTVQAPETSGNYSVNVTAGSDGLSARAEPILRVIPAPDEPPRISDFSLTPQNVTASDDVLVSAGVSDDHGVQNVTLAFRVRGGPFTRVAMNATAPGRYTSSIPRQPENATVEFYLEAWDGMSAAYFPIGAPTVPASYAVVRNDPGREWVRLFASLNATSCLAGRPLLATGYVRNETGGPVAGACVELRFESAAAGAPFSAETDGRGVFQLDAVAPSLPGNYTVRMACHLGALSNCTTAALTVRDVLTVRLYAQRSSVEASRRLAVDGTVFRQDGSAAAGASVRIQFESTGFWWDCLAGPDGKYCATVQAPARSGSYLLNATASFSGIEGAAGLRIAVLDPPRQSPWGGAPVLLAALALSLAAMTKGRKRR